MIFKNIFKIKKHRPVKEEQKIEINRLQELRHLKQLANTYLDFYLEQQKGSEKDWEKDLSNRNISLLKATIKKLHKLQRNDKIAEYLEAIRSTPPLYLNSTEEEKQVAFQKLSKNYSIAFSQGTFLSLLIEINRCSPRLSYFNDLSWFKHHNIGEYLDYGFGKADETVFEKYLPYQLNCIIETKKFFFSKEYFKDDLILLDAILPLIETEKFIPANILIITMIEGIVRKFALLVYKKQNPEITDEAANDFAYIRNRSLEKLIKNSAWQKDIPISFDNFMLEYAHTDNPTVTDFEVMLKIQKMANARIQKKLSDFRVMLTQHMENPKLSNEEFKTISLNHLNELEHESVYLMNQEDKTVMISINVYFDFLAKKFKEDRNSIIHGKYSYFREKWKTLVYLTALQTLIEKINWYEKNVSFYIA